MLINWIALALIALWPFVFGGSLYVIYRSRSIFKMSVLWGYLVSSLFVIQMFLVVYLYLKPLNSCMAVNPQPDLDTCTILPAFWVRVAVNYNFFISLVLAILTTVLIVVAKSKQVLTRPSI